SLALSAWKEFHATRWALRINPSSGNLHPTEGYLLFDGAQLDRSTATASINPPAELDNTAVVCHYAPAEHALELRAKIARADWQALMAGFPADAFLIGLTSIH